MTAALETPRLAIRPFTLADAPAIQRLAGAREVAAGTLRIPHPYPEGAAEAWVLSRRGAFDRDEELSLAIARPEDGAVLGAIGLMLAPEDRHAEVGYWIGVPYWGEGYATEAARALIAWGFETLGLARIHASHDGNNPASGAVLRKAGMTLEGRLRRHACKWGQLEDLVLYGILREEYEAAASTGPPPTR